MDTMEPGSAEAPKAPKAGGGIGAVVGIIIIVILLALGGVYYFTTGVDNLERNDEAPTIVGDEAAALKEQGTSTELADIEADLTATDFSGLDEASADFESELEAQ